MTGEGKMGKDGNWRDEVKECRGKSTGKEKKIRNREHFKDELEA